MKPYHVLNLMATCLKKLKTSFSLRTIELTDNNYSDGNIVNFHYILTNYLTNALPMELMK